MGICGGVDIRIYQDKGKAMRGRKPSIGYRQRGGGGYFFTHNGKPIALAMGPDDSPNGPTYQAAFKKWCQLQAQDTNRGTNGYAVSALFNRRREFLTTEGKTASLNNCEHMLKPFADKFGKLPCADVLPSHVRLWLQGQSTWGQNTKRLAHKLLSGCFTWGIMEGLITSNPIKGKMEMVKERVKGKDARLSAELAELIISQAGEDFAQYLTMCRRTGARPEEIENVTAAHLDDADGCIVFSHKAESPEYLHKQARKGSEKDRVVNMPASLYSVCNALARVNPVGPIFKTLQGKPWTADNRSYALRAILRKAAVKSHLEANKLEGSITCYNYRATWITEMVEDGISFAIIAEWCGNSAAIIERYYSRPDRTKIRNLYHKHGGE